MMRNAFVRMNPKTENMVTENLNDKDTLVLCVECGWEDSVGIPVAPWLLFMGHRCRLLSQSESTDF